MTVPLIPVSFGSSHAQYSFQFQFFTSRPRAAPPAVPIVTLRFCLFVCLSVCARSGEACERVNGGSCQTWLFRVSWFVPLLAAKGSKTLSVLSTVEAQLSLHKYNVVKAAQETREWQNTGGLLQTNQGRAP